MGADVQFEGLVGSFVNESAFHSELMAGGIFGKRWDCLQADDMRQMPSISLLEDICQTRCCQATGHLMQALILVVNHALSLAESVTPGRKLRPRVVHQQMRSPALTQQRLPALAVSSQRAAPAQPSLGQAAQAALGQPQPPTWALSSQRAAPARPSLRQAAQAAMACRPSMTCCRSQETQS